MFEFFYPFDLAFARSGNALLESAGAFFTPVLRGITFLGEIGWAFALTALVMLLFRRTRRAGVAAVIALLLGAVVVNLILKNAVARPRPFHDPSSVFYGFWQEAGSVKVSEYSFPSGHATVSASFAAVMFIAFSKKTSWLFFLIPLVMGFSRIYLQVHFASDVLFGYLVGGACGVGGWYLEKLLAKWKAYARFRESGNVADWIKNWKRKRAAAPEDPEEGE